MFLARNKVIVLRRYNVLGYKQSDFYEVLPFLNEIKMFFVRNKAIFTREKTNRKVFVQKSHMH